MLKQTIARRLERLEQRRALTARKPFVALLEFVGPGRRVVRTLLRTEGQPDIWTHFDPSTGEQIAKPVVEG